MRKNVAIIGGGIAGLSAGCYLQMNGYNTQIFELHTLPGGLCTSWKRKRYDIDTCIHWLSGSSPRSNFYDLWNELIDMNTQQFVYHDEYNRVEDKDGNVIIVFTDIDRLERELLQKAPEDRDVILKFTHAVKKLLPFTPSLEKAPETFNLFDKGKRLLKTLPYKGTFREWATLSMQEYAEQCQNPLLKKTFQYLFFPNMVALFMVIALRGMHKKSAGYPIGGSLKFARLIEQRYHELGGTINYKSKVTKIVTENDSATGIRLENGETRQADCVISAADGHYTIFDMLEGKYVDATIKEYYDTHEVIPSYLQVSLGIARTFENDPHAVVFPLEQLLHIDDNTQHENMGVTIYNFDPTLAPEGKTLLTIMLVCSNYTYWENLKTEQPDKYTSEKTRIANEVIDILEKRYGNIRQHVEMVDVSTPATVIRYTNNWQGSLEGWIASPKIAFKPMKKVLPGLKNFYMAGQWVEPGGGLPVAMMSGRNVTQIICKEDHNTFTTTHY
jgi:phytoene dehydrogenase-like protein